MQNEWIHKEIQKLRQGIEYMESGAVGAACDIVDGQSPAEREAQERAADEAHIAMDRNAIAGLEALGANA